LFDLGNQCVVASCDALFNRSQKSARRLGGFCGLLKFSARAGLFCRRNFLAFVSFDFRQNIRHGAFDTAINLSRRAFAAPLSIDFAASAAPSFKSLAFPATISEAAALITETSRNGPGVPLSTSSSALAF